MTQNPMMDAKCSLPFLAEIGHLILLFFLLTQTWENNSRERLPVHYQAMLLLRDMDSRLPLPGNFSAFSLDQSSFLFLYKIRAFLRCLYVNADGRISSPTRAANGVLCGD